MKSTEAISGVKVYDVSGKKLFHDWTPSRELRKLSKKPENENRVDLLQEFNFPTSCQRMQITKDGKYLVATGVYPPQVRVFDLEQLSLHFKRHIDSEAVQLQMFSDDYTKFCLLTVDRWIGLQFFSSIYPKKKKLYSQKIDKRVPRESKETL